MNFTVQVHNDETGGFWAEVEELLGCITQGDTAEELEANLKEAIELCLEGLIQDYVGSLLNKQEVEPGDSTWNISLKLQRDKTMASA